jgi:hypothetical protein
LKKSKISNLHEDWILEEITLPSMGASFKKWGCCTSIIPKQKIKNKIQKFGRTDGQGACAAVSRRPLVGAV